MGGVSTRLAEAEIAIEHIRFVKGEQPADLSLKYTVVSPRYPSLTNDESCQLEVSAKGIVLSATETLGVLKSVAEIITDIFQYAAVGFIQRDPR